jgi:hypothetical protein
VETTFRDPGSFNEADVHQNPKTPKPLQYEKPSYNHLI